jgi:aspartate/methionine/tyrosine aminotransferase
MTDFQPFVMERAMSKFERTVKYNLSESGVHPVSLSELLADDPAQIELLLETGLNYPHVNGTPELREKIASLYDGADPANVLVTVGAAEANYLTVRTLLSAGDEILVMLPNYMQIWGIAKNHALDVKTFHLREETGWALDAEELDRLVSSKTRLIAVCNPNNPTGHILTEAEMDVVVAAAERAGAWILSDEVYSGAERLADEESPSFYGRYERVVAVGGLSKAYGLPGLRIGWVVCPAETVDDIWARHEYVAISATVLGNRLAAIALSPEVRPRLIERTREYVRAGYSILGQWLNNHKDAFSLTPPQAGAIAFPRYRLEINSSALAERLRKEKSVLIVPGDHFGMDGFVRVNFGLPRDYLIEALDRVSELIVELRR